jgi:AraC family transcriptional activator of pobA
MDPSIDIEASRMHPMPKECNEPYYLVILFDGQASFSVNFTTYTCSGKSLIFLAPYQLLQWHEGTSVVRMLKFHGDFYCIEYHKEEVSCNGILFNNIYTRPFVSVPPQVFEEVSAIFSKIENFERSPHRYDLSILKSYLQLILALSSREKQVEAGHVRRKPGSGDISDFPVLLEKYLKTKSVSFFAAHYGLSAGAFSKKVKAFFYKPPSVLIRERLVLEAKKLLHLSYKNIKEIANELGFEDEFYFSRYFKTEVGVSPKTFRKRVGISIAAK